MKKWKRAYSKFIHKHNLHSRIFAIEYACIRQQNHLSPTQIKIYNGLLNLRMQGIKHADKKCRKLMMGQVPYSNVLQSCRLKISLWNAALTRKRGCKFSLKKMKRLEKRCNKYNTHLHTEEWISSSLEQAKKNYKKKKKKAAKLRLKFLEDKALAIAKEGNLELAQVYQQLITTEKQRSAARKIKWALGKSSKGAITSVDVMTNDERTTLTKKEPLERWHVWTQSDVSILKLTLLLVCKILLNLY